MALKHCNNNCVDNMLHNIIVLSQGTQGMNTETCIKSQTILDSLMPSNLEMNWVPNSGVFALNYLEESEVVKIIMSFQSLVVVKL